MNTTKSYIRPATNTYQLCPKDRMMGPLAPTYGDGEPNTTTGAPIRLPEDN